MKKNRSKILSVLIAMMLFLMMGMTVIAADAKTSGYTATIYRGGLGSWNMDILQKCIYLNDQPIPKGMYTVYGDVIYITGLSKDDKITFAAQPAIILNESSQYRALGIKRAGRLDSYVVNTISMEQGNADYVIAYSSNNDTASYLADDPKINGLVYNGSYESYNTEEGGGGSSANMNSTGKRQVPAAVQRVSVYKEKEPKIQKGGTWIYSFEDTSIGIMKGKEAQLSLPDEEVPLANVDLEMEDSGGFSIFGESANRMITGYIFGILFFMIALILGFAALIGCAGDRKKIRTEYYE